MTINVKGAAVIDAILDSMGMTRTNPIWVGLALDGHEIVARRYAPVATNEPLRVIWKTIEFAAPHQDPYTCIYDMIASTKPAGSAVAVGQVIVNKSPGNSTIAITVGVQ